MEIEFNSSGKNASVIVFIIRIVIVVVVGFGMLAGSLGGYILKNFCRCILKKWMSESVV